jgi:hypothetical protein
MRPTPRSRAPRLSVRGRASSRPARFGRKRRCRMAPLSVHFCRSRALNRPGNALPNSPKIAAQLHGGRGVGPSTLPHHCRPQKGHPSSLARDCERVGGNGLRLLRFGATRGPSSAIDDLASSESAARQSTDIDRHSEEGSLVPRAVASSCSILSKKFLEVRIIVPTFRNSPLVELRVALSPVTIAAQLVASRTGKP